MEMVLDHLLDRVERPLHLSFDIDAVDPLYAPSTGTRVAGGLSYREAYYICEAVAHSGTWGWVWFALGWCVRVCVCGRAAHGGQIPGMKVRLGAELSRGVISDERPIHFLFPPHPSMKSAGCLASMDLVEVNPTLTAAGGDETTVDLAVGLISSALGNSII
jgi:hypothetical protein